MNRRPPRTARSIRVEGALWEAARATAEKRGEVLSEEIRKFLTQYVNAEEKK